MYMYTILRIHACVCQIAKVCKLRLEDNFLIEYTIFPFTASERHLYVSDIMNIRVTLTFR